MLKEFPHRSCIPNPSGISKLECFHSSVHVVFGQVISGQEVVKTMESQKADPGSKPYSEVKVLNCGELIPKSRGRHCQCCF